MTEEARRDPLNEPVPERQGVSEPRPIDDGEATRDAGESDLGARREFEAGDLARENEPPPPRPRDRDTAGDEHLGMLDRVRQTWDRIRQP